MKRLPYIAFILIILQLTVMPTLCAKDEEKSDVVAVKKFLNTAFPKKKWIRGPERLRNEAIDSAYTQVRFYFVFSPEYPLARPDQITRMLRIDSDNNISIVEKTADYNVGLMKISSEKDAKTAAAAIMSLTVAPFGPVPVKASDVVVVQKDHDWNCKVKKRQGQWKVSFDKAGKCTAATYRHLGPLPICIGGLFRPVSVPEGIDRLTHSAGVALLVKSVEPSRVAARAGLVPGDIIVSFDNKPLPAENTIQRMRQVVYKLKQQGNVQRQIQIVRDRQVIEKTLCW